ncbi:MAG: photosystem I reaction center subunit XII [Synechococcaceae cyanobacterium SM2_3_1]|jgi:photosystem I reaction center subunit XII|nr:photosystem I reaction center subunit XII [Synechococcaceae cyanobacterium SM2_3_1]
MLSEAQIFIILGLALVPALFALLLGSALARS